MKKDRSGISLIELILTLALFSIFIQVIYSVFFVSNASYSISTSKGFAQQDVRILGNFIKSEFKYVTNLSITDDYTGKYFSLRIEEVDGIKVFTKMSHIYIGDGTEASKEDATTSSIVNTIKGSWDSVTFTNKNAGEVDVLIFQEEITRGHKAEYELPIKIITFNNNNLLTNIENFDLVSGQVLYYQNTSASNLSRGIDITTSSEGIDYYTVSFDSQGGTPTPIDITAKYGSYQNMPIAKPSLSGYIFNGWYTEPQGQGEKYNESTILIPNRDITLYASWIAGTINQVGIEGIHSITGNPSLEKHEEYYKVKKNQGGSVVKIKLSNYTASHKDLVKASVTGISGVIDNDGYLTFSVELANKTSSLITVTVETPGFSAVTKTFGFYGIL